MKIYNVHVVLFDKKYHFFTEDYGGVIISHKNYKKGQKLFENGMHLSIAVKNLICFGENKKDLWESHYAFKYRFTVDLEDWIKKGKL